MDYTVYSNLTVFLGRGELSYKADYEHFQTSKKKVLAIKKKSIYMTYPSIKVGIICLYSYRRTNRPICDAGLSKH